MESFSWQHPLFKGSVVTRNRATRTGMNLKKEVKNIKRKISAEPIITVDNEYRLKQRMSVKIAARLITGRSGCPRSSAENATFRSIINKLLRKKSTSAFRRKSSHP
jgi:hypothetical protein